MEVVAYYRVSTGAQEKSGLGLEAQVDYVHSAARQQGWKVVAEYTETVSGTIAPQDRPECKKALAHGLPVLVAKLDRIGRDVGHIAELMKRTSLKVATMPLADNFQLHLFAALAEQERSFIASRTRDALAALKARADDGDVASIEKLARRAGALVMGRTQANRDKASKAILERVTTWTESVRDPIDLCIRKGATTLQQVADCLNDKGIGTSRGGEWSSMQVSRVMKSLSLSFPL
ncbi:recombinase family protein [Pseudomonas violetae]|uniref:Recombinase family protein n=1 Tax=Pseudomonas violetae TaxID=2915813 RepID=A0ABT0F8X7_9PSED|nr:recombinase family protein [Pseudomonas violetae]MCK1794094.1 recombinase family protein [Pseudomonas violetae]